MNKFRFSSKMHLFIIITSVLIAIGLAVGLVCHFVWDSFFSWGGDYASYNKVEIKYSALEISEEDVRGICDDVFDENGVIAYTDVTSGNSTESRIEYRFAADEDAALLTDIAEEIQTSVRAENPLASANYSFADGVLGAQRDIMYAGIALASAVVFQFLYFIIRYKFTMALAAFIADVHNLALFYALLAITRVQVSSSVIALSVFAVLLTMICCGVLFEKMRKAFRTDEYKAMSSLDQADAATRSAVKPVAFICGTIAAAFAVIAIFTAIGAMSVYGLFMPCICGILAVLACAYGTLFFVPSVYSRFKLMSDNRAKNKASRYVGAKKSAKAAE